MKQFNLQFANHSKLEQLKLFFLGTMALISNSKRANSSLFKVK